MKHNIEETSQSICSDINHFEKKMQETIESFS